MTQSVSIHFFVSQTNLLVKMENPFPLCLNITFARSKTILGYFTLLPKSSKSSDHSQVMAGVEKGLEQLPLFCNCLSLSVRQYFSLMGTRSKISMLLTFKLVRRHLWFPLCASSILLPQVAHIKY